ncbi:MAG TPA: pitrilysin family protein [Anaeromyxobacteraceae bacterium]|jgi:zinc protease|nr:pitrilysin family protein [Anaeromyxobacteraceae bacterium]
MTSPLVLLLGAALAAAAPPPAPEIPYTSFKLSNGLNVILSEDHTAPVVGVDILYDVGSKDEKPGRTGFAHLFEHLMFEGSAHVEKGEGDRLIEADGGSSNGGTRPDATQYWEQVPKNALEQMLYLEADRMGFLLPTLDQAKLDNQREVVRNERRQNYEMRPYGLAMKSLLEQLWDPQFPYHWEPIGSHEDLQAATLEDVREFFQRYYGPNDATLAIAGDFDPRVARAMVEKWFGDIPAGPRIERKYPTPVPLTGEKRLTIEDNVQLPKLYIGWQTPKLFADGDAALDMVGQVLSDGKSARLVKRMVMDEQIAQSVMAGQQSQALAGMFMLVATPKPGQSLARLEKEIDEELAKLSREAPTPGELERARNKTEAEAIFGLEPVGGFSGRAAVLNSYYLRTGDPGYFPKDLARYRALTAEDLRAAAAKYLRKDARVVLVVMPKKKGSK